MMDTITPVDDHDVTRADILEALRFQVHAARREFPKVGNKRAPTPWDRRHAAINDLLTNLEMLDSLDTLS